MALTGYMSADNDPLRMETGLECGCCQQEIEATEEVLFLTIAQLQQVGNDLQYTSVLKTDGDYQFSPLFVHLSHCWKEIEEDLHDRVEDEPPVKDELSLLACSFCKSGIREWEYLGLGQFGEFLCSPRQPDRTTQVSYTFEPWGGRAALNVQICLACIAKLGEEMLDDWEEVSQLGECVFCTICRCWRSPPCSCFCHLPDEN